MRAYLGRPVWCLPLLAAVCLSSCTYQGNGNFCIGGYTTLPNYNTSIHTVYVPMFENRTYRDLSRDGLEQELTMAVVTQIEAKTPYKVVGPNEQADTELKGVIVSYNKLLLNRNQLNEVREAETDLMVQVVWKDLRSGEILSEIKRRLDPLPPPIDTPVVQTNAPIPHPAVVTSTAGFIPELGESMRTARQKNTNYLAVQIVSMMEKPW
jgi:hypothetical protein